MDQANPLIRIDNPGPRTAGTGWFRFRIGEMEATVVSGGRMRPHSTADFFPDITIAELEPAKARASIDADYFRMEQNCLILRYDGRVVLFDTGVGQDQVSGWEASGILMQSMARGGIESAEVTDIVLTHAHSDLVWDMVSDDRAVLFRNARAYLSRVEVDYWTDTAKLPLGGFTATAFRALVAICYPASTAPPLSRRGRKFCPASWPLAPPGPFAWPPFLQRPIQRRPLKRFAFDVNRFGIP